MVLLMSFGNCGKVRVNGDRNRRGRSIRCKAASRSEEGIKLKSRDRERNEERVITIYMIKLERYKKLLYPQLHQLL